MGTEGASPCVHLRGLGFELLHPLLSGGDVSRLGSREHVVRPIRLLLEVLHQASEVRLDVRLGLDAAQVLKETLVACFTPDM